MLKCIAFAALTGFLAAICWIILGFVFFNAHNGWWADLYYLGARLVCPIFPITSTSFEYGPPINACLYGFVMWLFLVLRKRVSKW